MKIVNAKPYYIACIGCFANDQPIFTRAKTQHVRLFTALEFRQGERQFLTVIMHRIWGLASVLHEQEVGHGCDRTTLSPYTRQESPLRTPSNVKALSVI